MIVPDNHKVRLLPIYVILGKCRSDKNIKTSRRAMVVPVSFFYEAACCQAPSVLIGYKSASLLTDETA